MKQQAEVIRSFVDRLDQDHEFSIESEGRFWYLLKEEDIYCVSSSASLTRVPFTDSMEAVFYLLTRIGSWTR